jgi:hypothetical protein
LDLSQYTRSTFFFISLLHVLVLRNDRVIQYSTVQGSSMALFSGSGLYHFTASALASPSLSGELG